jgi:alpha-beta hydrolase superfamily lysophospholipase
MKTFEAQWENEEGINFFSQGWGPDERQPKAFIALIHGLGDHTSRFTHVGRAMTDAGYALAGFDLRGHGRSGGARGHAPSLDAYMQDIRRFFQLMTPRYPQIPHFLYGHSLGGLLAYVQSYGAGLGGSCGLVCVIASGAKSKTCPGEAACADPANDDHTEWS